MNKSLKGKPGTWYQDEVVGGYYDDKGRLVICEEYGTDEQLGRHSQDVLNGYGYYDSNGKYVKYNEL